MSDLPSRGKRFDFRRVLEHAPDAQEALHATEAAITAGDLIRRVRMRKGMSQTTLAERVGTTQSHLSKIERGLCENGPTVGTLSRLLRELDDELVVQSREERNVGMTEQINAAVGELREPFATNAQSANQQPAPGSLAALGELICRLNPYTEIPPDQKAGQVNVVVEENYGAAQWAFKGQTQHVNSAVRIPYRFPVKDKDGNVRYWQTEHLLIGYASEEGGG